MKRKFMLSFILSLICFSLVFVFFGEKILSTIDISKGKNHNQTDLELGEGNKIEQRVKNEIVFLLMGVDANGTSQYKGIRTDVMIIFKVNFDNGSIDLLSIPRDTRAKVNGKNSKINHAHSIGGPSLTMRTIREFLNIDLDYYVKVDYNAVMEIVDAIGGVKIDVPFDMEYKDNTPGHPPLNINIKKGERILDGKNAHDFLRWRKNNSRTVAYADGDVGRIKAQQMFMEELIKQTIQPKNIIKLPALLKTYFNNVETNISMKEALKGVKLATNIDMDQINSYILPGEGEYIGRTSYYIHYEDKTRELIQELFKDYLIN